MTFSPATAYRDDWRHQELIEDGAYEPQPGTNASTVTDLKVKRDDAVLSDFTLSRPSYTTTGVGLMVWETKDFGSFKPRPSGRIRTDAGEYIVRSATESRFGNWLIQAEEARHDSDG